MMRAAWYTQNGPAKDTLIVGEMDKPTPGPGEVRVQLKTSGVNPSDVKSRIARPLNAPYIIPHSDGAGVIDAVGSGVDQGRIGERVWIWNGQWVRPLGTACEFIVLDEHQATRLPESTSFAEGACLGIPALTALQAVNLCGDLKGKTVLVTGAASSVGHYAAQLCVQAGARVIGTVGNQEKTAHAKGAGVSECIFYKTESVPDRIKSMTNGRGVDAVIDMDFSSSSQWLAQGALAPHGIFACYGSNIPGDITINFRPLLFQSITFKFFLIYDITPGDRIRTLAQMTHLLENQKLKHTVAKTFSLSDIAQAHLAVEEGRFMGNVVIEI